MTTTTSSVRWRGASARSMRSWRGSLGALVLLLALPVTIGVALVVPNSEGVTIHMALALGTLLLGWSAFDFQGPRWMTWTACGAATVLAAIFFAQGLAELTHQDTLQRVAFSSEIGAWGEVITSSIVMLWFMSVALRLRGVTMLVGLLSAGVVLGLNVTSLLVGSLPQESRLLFLLPIVWFLYVSRDPAND